MADGGEETSLREAEREGDVRTDEAADTFVITFITNTDPDPGAGNGCSRREELHLLWVNPDPAQRHQDLGPGGGPPQQEPPGHLGVRRGFNMRARWTSVAGVLENCLSACALLLRLSIVYCVSLHQLWLLLWKRGEEGGWRREG